jgi:hypothetical protein
MITPLCIINTLSERALKHPEYEVLYAVTYPVNEER